MTPKQEIQMINAQTEKIRKIIEEIQRLDRELLEEEQAEIDAKVAARHAEESDL